MDECCYSSKLPNLNIDALVEKIRDAENRLLEMVCVSGRNYELHMFPNHYGSNFVKLYDVDAKEYVCTLITEFEDDKVMVKMFGPDVDLNSVTEE